MHLTLHPPGVFQLGRLLWRMLENSGVKGWVSLRDAEHLATICDCDIRSCFGTLVALGESPLLGKGLSQEAPPCDFRQWVVNRRILGSALDDVQANQADQWAASPESEVLGGDDRALAAEVLRATASTLTFLADSGAVETGVGKTSKGQQVINMADEEGLDDDEDDEPRRAAVVTNDAGEEEEEFEGAAVVSKAVQPPVIDEANSSGTSEICFSPIVLSVEPRNVDMWAGGVIHICGKNFMQRRGSLQRRGGQVADATDEPLARVTVTVGNHQYHETVRVYSDNEIGVAVGSFLTKPSDPLELQSWKFRSKRAPKQIQLVEVTVSFSCGTCLGSSLCGSEQSWVCFTDTRAPDEIANPAPVVVSERPPLPRQNGRSKRKRLGRKKSSAKQVIAAAASSDCESVVGSADGTDSEECSAGQRALCSSSRVQDSDDDDFQEDPVFVARVEAAKRQRVVDDDDDDEEGGGQNQRAVVSKGRQICEEDECAGDDEDGDEEPNAGPNLDDTIEAGECPSLPSSQSDPIDVQQVLRQVVEALAGHPLASPFALPVDPDQHPAYSATVSAPMDIGTIASSVEEGLYNTVEECLQDVEQLWTNCAHSDFYSQDVKEAAIQLQRFVSGLMSEVLADPPLLQREESSGDAAKEAATEVPGSNKALDDPPSAEAVRELLAKAERERVHSGGRVVNSFFDAEESASSLLTKFSRRECFCMDFSPPLPSASAATSTSAAQELASLEQLSAYLDASSDADLMRGLLGVHGDGDEDVRGSGGCRWVDESSVLSHLASDNSSGGASSEGAGAAADRAGEDCEGEGLTVSLACSAWDLRSIADVADVVCMLGRSLYMNQRYLLSKDSLGLGSPSGGCMDVFTRPRKKQERIQFLLEACCNVAPNRWPSNGAHSDFSLRSALALDVVPQLALMLRAQSPEAMESSVALNLQQDEFSRFRRSTRAAVGRSHSVQRCFTRMAALLQVPDSTLEKLMHILPLPFS
jgi:hypothetical protein